MIDPEVECDGLNGKCPQQAHVFKHLVPFGGCYGAFRIKSLSGGSMSLRVRSEEFIKPCLLPVPASKLTTPDCYHPFSILRDSAWNSRPEETNPSFLNNDKSTFVLIQQFYFLVLPRFQMLKKKNHTEKYPLPCYLSKWKIEDNRRLIKQIMKAHKSQVTV